MRQNIRGLTLNAHAIGAVIGHGKPDVKQVIYSCALFDNNSGVGGVETELRVDGDRISKDDVFKVLKSALRKWR